MQRRPKIEEGQVVGVRNGLRWPYGDTRARRLRGGARKADEGRISRKKQKIAMQILRIWNTGGDLKYYSSGTEKIRMKHKSLKEVWVT